MPPEAITTALDRVDPDGSGREAADVGVPVPPAGPPVLVSVYIAGSRRRLEPDVGRSFALIAHGVATDAISIRQARKHARG